MRAFVITKSITPREQRSMECYLQELSKYEVLSADEEAELFKEYQSGDEAALSEIINHNLRFVVSVAKKYQNMGLSLSDLVNEGNLGMIKATKRFDLSKGFKFISYAVWWIRQSILQALSDKGRKIRLPLNMTGSMSKVRKQLAEINQREERAATVEEIADATGLAVSVVQRCMDNSRKCASLDAPLKHDSATTMVDIMEDQNLTHPDHQLSVIETQKTHVHQILNKLPERDARILSMYYGIDRQHPASLSEISDEIGLSAERIRQIKDRAISRLRVRSKNFMHVATFRSN